MISFFLIARALQLNYILKFHFLNVFIIIPAVWLSCYNEHKLRGDNFRYLHGLLSGVKTIIVASVMLNFFIVIYLSFINPARMQYIHQDVLLGEYMNPLVIGLAIFTE